MAVYTKLNEINIKEVLSNYSIGSLNNFKGIQEGIENTNYFLLVNAFIITDKDNTVDIIIIMFSIISLCNEVFSCYDLRSLTYLFLFL